MNITTLQKPTKIDELRGSCVFAEAHTHTLSRFAAMCERGMENASSVNEKYDARVVWLTLLTERGRVLRRPHKNALIF